MTRKISLKQAHAELDHLLNEAAETREPIVIQRPDGINVALIAEDELASLMETAHLVRSSENAERLLQTLAGSGGATVEDIRRALGLPPE
jgi:antitoxin YefM